MATKLSSRLRPIAAIVAVLAVGATGAIVGSAFADGETVIAQAGTQTVPVLAPIGHGPDAPAQNPDGDESTLDVSRAVAEQQVPIGDSTELDPRLADLLDDLATADDPGAVVDPTIALEALDGDSPSPEGGDPCAPVDGEPAADCPSGLGGTVLALRAAPHPDVVGTANPPVYEDSLHKLYYCDPQEHGPTDLPFVAASNAPASIAITYWPISEPHAITRLNLETPAAARTDWERHFEVGDPFGEWTRIQHCTVLEGLKPGVGYRFRLDSVDIMGGEASFTSTFALSDSSTRPPTRVVPLGDNIIVVSLPHAATESVEFNAFVVADGAETDCTTRHTQLESLATMRTAEVSAAHLQRNGYQARFTKRSSQAFWVPEGSTIGLCLSSYLESRPSYDWARANYRHQETLHSPDRMVPTVILDSVDLVRTVAERSVRVAAATRDNLGCGPEWRGPAAAGDDVPASDLRDAVLCSIGNHSGLVGLTTSSGDVVVQTAVRQGEAVTSTRSLLALGRGACRGLCEAPGTSWYRISLATIQVPDGICGSSFGECDPPTRESSAGTALLKVEWEQGNRNGLSEWGRTVPVSGQPAVPAPPAYPQMDTQERITVTRVPGLSTADASFLLATDRPVNYTARLASRCAMPGGITEVTGRSEGRTTVHFKKLCIGELHTGQVELTDDSGAVTTYNVSAGDHLWAHGAAGVGYPADPSMLSWSFNLRRTEPSRYHLSDLQSLGIFVDGVALSDRVALGCQPDSDVRRSSLLTPDVHLSELVTVQVWARLAPAATRSDGRHACQPALDPGELSFTAEVRRSELLGDGVTISAPDGGEYHFSLALRAS